MYYPWGRNKMTFSQGMEGKLKGKTFNFKTYLKQRKKKPCSTTSNFSYKEKFNVR